MEVTNFMFAKTKLRSCANCSLRFQRLCKETFDKI